MSKKKLLEFGLKEADAFQKNFKIIFDRLVRGYKSVMGKDPEGLDLLKVKIIQLSPIPRHHYPQ